MAVPEPIELSCQVLVIGGGLAASCAARVASSFCPDVLVVHKMDRFARKLRTTLECMDRLGRARVGFVSVLEPELDYSTPQGFLFFGMVGTLAEWYSRNLAEEIRKGYRERKAQGLYAGHLPFGARKGPDGVPVPDTEPFIDRSGRVTNNNEGLLLAFEHAAQGATYAEVAAALNAASYRPSVYGRRALFTKSAVRTILTNRFYIGELPIGKRGAQGSMPGRHTPLVPMEVFNAVQEHRRQRDRHRGAYTAGRRNARVRPLSGVAHCEECGEPFTLSNGRMYCRGRWERVGCKAPSVVSRLIEQQLADHLAKLTLPPEAKELILGEFRKLKPQAAQHVAQHRAIEMQIQRNGERYEIGEIDREEWLRRGNQLRIELARLPDYDKHGSPETLTHLEQYLLDTGTAWNDASDSQRNRLARAIFEAVYIRDGRLSAVLPRAEFQPFFVLASRPEPPVPNILQGWARRDSGEHLQNLFSRMPVAIS